jgi:hypothetical protein
MNPITPETTYRCPICKQGYDTQEGAMHCAEKGTEKPIVEVGDIVLGAAGFGWYDGDRKWIKNPDVKKHPEHGNCFGICCTYAFYYVVTAIDTDPRDAHRIRYHLFTKAMSEEEGYNSGYTFNVGHIRPRKVREPPKEVVEDSKDLIGEKAGVLL